MLRPTNIARVFALSCLFFFLPCTVQAQQATTTAATGLVVAGLATGRQINADKTVYADIHDFGVRDTIYVSVRTHGSGTGTLAARWFFEDQLVIESSQEIAPTGDASHEFHIAKASAWPKGSYRVVILLDGDSVTTKDFHAK